MGKKTALYQQHLDAGGSMVPFAGWDMPLHYGSQIKEHLAVRGQCGMFDVSHMVVLDFHGQPQTLLMQLLTNNISHIKPGQAMYSCMLNEQAGVMDDLIVYHMGDWYRMVVNAATREKDTAWINHYARSSQAQISERSDLSMIAVQGPQAREVVHSVLGSDVSEKTAALKRFEACVNNNDLFIARTGYTGEDGYEIIAPHAKAVTVWQQLHAKGVQAIGLGARDSLRLEAGMHLYGNDMDESISPLEAGLGWTVAWQPNDRNFTGRKALEIQKTSGVKRKLVGLVLRDKGVLRHGQHVFSDGNNKGQVTSGGYSPNLKCSIGLASVSQDLEQHCDVEIRGKHLRATIVKPPFVRNGKACIDIQSI